MGDYHEQNGFYHQLISHWNQVEPSDTFNMDKMAQCLQIQINTHIILIRI